MSLFRIGMALVMLTLMAVGASIWLNDRTPHSVPASGSSSLSPKMVGRSAIGHGGLPGERPVATAHPSPVPFFVGQHVIVDQPVVVSPSAQPATTLTLSPGTEMVVSAVDDLQSEHPERYYEIRSSDGLTGRVPEHALRPRDTGAGAP